MKFLVDVDVENLELWITCHSSLYKLVLEQVGFVGTLEMVPKNKVMLRL